VFDLAADPHRRFNPLLNEWVIVSPHRNERPWQGTVEAPPADAEAPYDPECYLCPGNARAGAVRNPSYASTFVFDNDFPALMNATSSTGRPACAEAPAGKPPLGGPEEPAASAGPDLLVADTQRGICRVVCFSPRHDLTLARMETAAIRAVVDTWVDEQASLATMADIAYATIFENRGAMMGASNPHPHGQIWATEHVPNEPAREIAAMAAYRSRRGTCMLCDYVALESHANERIVCANDGFVALVPFWAAWPFEMLVLSRRHMNALTALSGEERSMLADILKQVTTRYDNVFDAPFPYSMGFHQQPLHDQSPDVHLHAHFYPPLLRSATVKKFMVGFELLGSPQRDVTPEKIAARLRAVSPVHYRERG
jgi:UDPglucose--hexose-1-phosphate uridylyltransferase